LLIRACSGGLSGTKWVQLGIVLPWVVPAFIGALMLSRSIALLSLGDEIALSLGRWIIPCSAMMGALLIVFADLAARMINAPEETLVGVLIALIGVPFFLYLARKERRTLF
jgi:iron complex transport system permease protein